MSNDPVGYTAKNPVMSFNRYLYANNNPYKYKDPDGQFFMFAIPLIVGALEGTAAITVAGVAVATAEVTLVVTTATLAGVAGAEAINQYAKENKGQTKPEVGDCPDCGGDTSNKDGKIAKDHGQKPKETKQRIHGLKNKAKISGNPDIEVCKDCGEVFPQTDSGELGDSIGNIDEDF